jgi:hypothetical protein
MWLPQPCRPDVSVVVVVYTAREALRTLLSLSAGHQRHIAADDYEVIVVDNGSRLPYGCKLFRWRCRKYSADATHGPTASLPAAANRGLAEAHG